MVFQPLLILAYAHRNLSPTYFSFQIAPHRLAMSLKIEKNHSIWWLLETLVFWFIAFFLTLICDFGQYLEGNGFCHSLAQLIYLVISQLTFCFLYSILFGTCSYNLQSKMRVLSAIIVLILITFHTFWQALCSAESISSYSLNFLNGYFEDFTPDFVQIENWFYDSEL